MSRKINRIIEKEISDCLDAIGAVSVVGPKSCGKTYISNLICKSHYYVDIKTKWTDDLFRLNRDIIVEGDKPRLIDEWQFVPRIWDAVRNKIDRKKKKDYLY